MGDAEKIEGVGHGTPAGSARKQQRSRVTREQLLEAARRLFTQNGFEQTTLEDIATAAGKTRGAFYDHFEDKEDVFFAIFEDDLAKDEEHLLQQFSLATNAEARVEALADHLTSIAGERRRVLLNIEFKLYAIRKPHKTQRLAALHRAMCMRCAEIHIDALLPEQAGLSARHKRSRAALLGAVLDGLTLNRLFDELALSQQQVRLLIRAGLDIALRA